MFAYQRQESQQTLAEGISEYYSEFEKHFSARKMTPEAEAFFRCHDAVHVVFGCDISLDQELVVKISSILGTTAGIGVLKGYRFAESKEVYKELSLLDILRTTGKSLLIVPKTVWKCRRMSKRWDWDGFTQYLQVPLKDIRRNHRIRVG